MFDGQIPAGGIRLRAVLARQIKPCGEPLASRVPWPAGSPLQVPLPSPLMPPQAIPYARPVTCPVLDSTSRYSGLWHPQVVR
jgi:hypothetical protein